MKLVPVPLDTLPTVESSFAALTWARSFGLDGTSAPVAQRPTAVAVGAVEADEAARAVWADGSIVAAAVEGRAREHGLTLGVFPEEYELASVAELVAGDAPGAGASGPGFASLLLARREQQLLLACRPRPAAQAGRGLAYATFAEGVAGLRVLAQGGALPEIAFVADPAESELLLALAGQPTLDGGPVAGGALAIIIVAGDAGEAAARLETAVARQGLGGRECGQNVARAWAASRYEVPRVARVLAASGIRIATTSSWHPWSSFPAVLELDPEPGTAWRGRQVLGVGPHGALLLTRTLS